MKIIAIIGIIAIICWMALEVDSSTGWIDKFIYWIRENLGCVITIEELYLKKNTIKKVNHFTIIHIKLRNVISVVKNLIENNYNKTYKDIEYEI